MWNFSDISRVCRSASLIAGCAQGHISECIGQQVYRHMNFFRSNNLSSGFLSRLEMQLSMKLSIYY